MTKYTVEISAAARASRGAADPSSAGAAINISIRDAFIATEGGVLSCAVSGCWLGATGDPQVLVAPQAVPFY